MPADFLEALIDSWAATPALAAISPALHRDTPPPGVTTYPHACVSQVGGNKGGRNTGKGYWITEVYQVTVYHTDPAAARAAGEVVDAAIESLIDSPLAFDDGYQMQVAGLQHTQFRVPREFAKAGGFLYHDSHTYRVRIGKARP